MRFQLFFSFSTHLVNSIFSAVVRFYKILAIDETFFPSLQPLPWKVAKCLLFCFLLNTEINSFNTINAANPNYVWKKIESSKQRLLNKNCCDGVSFTLLLRTQIMESKKFNKGNLKNRFSIFAIICHIP